MHIYTTVCKEIASGNPLHSTGSSALCSVVTWKGGMGGGRRDICIHIADHFIVPQKLTQHFKVNIPQFMSILHCSLLSGQQHCV